MINNVWLGRMSGAGAGEDAAVSNDVSGSVSGHVVQAGQIHGDVHFHQPHAPARSIPRQLPPRLRHFVDRGVEQDALTTLLNGGSAAGLVLLSMIDGVAGVGKSSLVVHWAHHVRNRFPDGELYVNLRGFDPAAEPMPTADALRDFLLALDVAHDMIPVDPGNRASMLRSLLHGRRMLLVLDNARSTAQVRPLLPGCDGCLVLVTSRNRLDDLVMSEGASRISLEVLPHDQARDLLAGHLGADRVSSESAAVDALITCCAGLPLALSMVAFRAVQMPGVPLAELVEEVGDEQERLNALDIGGETGVRAVFSWSYRSLPQEAARLFRLFGLLRGPHVALDAVAALAGLPRTAARRVLRDLVQAHLVEQRGSDRYEMHDLLRSYAAECAARDEDAAERITALRRLVDHYLRTSRGVERSLTSHSRLFVPEPPDSEIRAKEFDTSDAGIEWWDAERANLVAVVEQAAAEGLHEHAWQLPYSLMYYFNLRRHTDDWSRSFNIAVRSARELGDRRAEGHLLEDLAGLHYSLQQYEEAIEKRAAALSLLDDTDPFYGMMLISHAYAHLRLGDFDSAEEPLHRGFRLRAAAGDANGMGYARAGFGLLHSGRGDIDEALTAFDEAVALYRRVGEQWGEGFVLNNRGDACLTAGRFAEAAATFRKAAEHRRAIGHRHGAATSLRGLGTALSAAGDVDGARNAWQEALQAFEKCGAAEAEAVRADLGQL
ncbi:ATP-binding protein [Saccharopolyspora gregorii]